MVAPVINYDGVEIPANGREPNENVWRAAVVRALIAAGMDYEAEQFRCCQDEASVQFYVVCPNDPDHQTVALARTCHLRICPECEQRNHARLLHRYHDPIEEVYHRAPSHYRLRHLILTTPISLLESDVKTQLRRVYDNLARFFDRLWGDDWRESGRGYLSGAEFGPEGLKLHFHVLALCDWIDQNKARDIWTDLTGFTALPYIKAVNQTNYTLTDALSEIIKYATKISCLEPNLVPTLLTAIAGTRRIRTRGAFYRLPQSDKEDKLCPECGAKLTVWHTTKFQFWKSGSIGRSLSAFDAGRLRDLLLRLGNKSQGLDPPEPPRCVEDTTGDYEPPPPRDYSTILPPMEAELC